MAHLFASAESEVEIEDRTEQLEKAHALLGARRFEIARLHFGHEWTQQEIADHLGISQPVVSREIREIIRIAPANAADRNPHRN